MHVRTVPLHFLLVLSLAASACGSEPAPAEAVAPVVEPDAGVAAPVVEPAAPAVADAPTAPEGGNPTATPADAPAHAAPPMAGAKTPAAAPAPAATPVPATPTPATTGAAPAPAPEALPAAPVPTVATYTLEPGKSALYVQVYKDAGTVAANLSHDHVIAATGWNGTVRWDPSDVAACKVDIVVPVAGLRPDEEAMRKRVGYDQMLDADQREEVKGNMLGSGQLNAKSFADIKFTSTKCEAAGDKVKVTGNLTVHGVAKPVTSTMKISADGAALSASGTFSAKATDFGFEPYSALLGALKNKNEMKFTVDVKGSAK
ncbi:MAG: YceI family protein [Pseudomonadota bacterium]|nr:YceI family protein [Pseudomonadota bacterium]